MHELIRILGLMTAGLFLVSWFGCAGLGQGRAAPRAASAPAAATLDEGATAPEVSGVGASGKPVGISEFRGKMLVLYFYPVDFSAGASAEAQEFRDDHAKYKKLGAAIVGVSTDDLQTHRDFAAKFKLPFALLSDPGGAVATAFGVPLEAGTAKHTTFVIDRGGVVRKVWRKVRPWGHSAEVLAFLKSAAVK